MEDVYYNPTPYQQEPNNLMIINQKLKDLEEQVSSLQKKLDDNALKTPEVHYHYSFDQLKIEKLEGTMNIGMPSQPGASSPEDFTIEDQIIQRPSVAGPKQPTDQYEQALENELMHYTEQILASRKQSEEWVMMPQDMEALILKDIRQQLPDRITYYMKRANKGAMSPEEAYASALTACKKDIDKALQLFLANQMNKGADMNEV